MAAELVWSAWDWKLLFLFSICFPSHATDEVLSYQYKIAQVGMYYCLFSGAIFSCLEQFKSYIETSKKVWAHCAFAVDNKTGIIEKTVYSANCCIMNVSV